ncbi:alpha-galactosidase [Sarcina sp. DSM 11001]|uniref:alpha-galactosidase n=1 Tax=Sarcina sp. DSM 11001 TaxID=1798184 RepID=UPI00087F7664|nr:alpha-galactosidase [Sarcina sp. DSM 11001]SDL63912.1 alpha-galactosidase [Sarcina sp. DSM 11001]
MNIRYFEKERIFKIDTEHVSYVMAVIDEEQFLEHVYFGRRLQDSDLRYLLRHQEAPFLPSTNGGERGKVLACMKHELPGELGGDHRDGAVTVRSAGGHTALQPYYVSHRIYRGKDRLEGLPATFGHPEETMTLEITMEDPVLGVRFLLSWSIFSDNDAVMRSLRVLNCSDAPVRLEKALSLSLDMDCTDPDQKPFRLLTLDGMWVRERHMNYRDIGYGFQGVSSNRGETSHHEQPFLGLVSPSATQHQGEVYGFHLVYSGNFRGQVERDSYDTIRVTLGINPDRFSFTLQPGESFQAPEGVMVYSCQGLGGMTHTFHDLYRNHLIRGIWRDKKRPILINNWEATYFDFDSDKLLDIARAAQKAGIEMLVMDDGWFGKRDLDVSGLGDWFVNENKIKGGLKKLVDEVNALGMKFGIWFEPEMISPDSDLYRAHPDWAIKIPGRTPTQLRNQYVLDLSRKEVRDTVYDMVAAVLRSANIEYVKWDMNRTLTDFGSACLGAENQDELCHRYVLGLYEMQGRLIDDFPYLLLENCSGGGARFDPGMLYYSPQIWCSDDTDAVERLMIQEGTSLLYPLSTMGAHVSVVPNHVVGRSTSFETRGIVALAGTFGYELDITKLSEKDLAAIPQQIALYHKYNDLIRRGDYVRIASYRENHLYDCYAVISKDKSEAVVTYVQVLKVPEDRSRILRIPGLDPDREYAVIVDRTSDIMPEEDPTMTLPVGPRACMRGDALMYAGLPMPNFRGDFRSALIYLSEI